MTSRDETPEVVRQAFARCDYLHSQGIHASADDIYRALIYFQNTLNAALHEKAEAEHERDMARDEFREARKTSYLERAEQTELALRNTAAYKFDQNLQVALTAKAEAEERLHDNQVGSDKLGKQLAATELALATLVERAAIEASKYSQEAADAIRKMA